MTLHRTSGRWKLGLILAATSTLLWGSLPIALLLMLRSMDAYTITWYRFLGAGLILLIYLIVVGGVPRLDRLTGKSLGMLLISSVTLCSNYLLYLLGLHFISPSAAQIVIQAAPLLLLFGGLLVFKEGFSIQQALGVGIFVTGFVLFFHPDLGEIIRGTGTTAVGVLCIFAAAFCWSIYALIQKQLLMQLTSVQIMACIYGSCVIFVLPFTTPGTVLELEVAGVLLLLYCILNSLVAYGSFAEALEHWEASRVSAVIALSPILTIAFMFVGARLYPDALSAENLDWLSLLGAGLVVVGSLTTALWKAGKKT